MAASNNLSKQFITVHHASESAVPPHRDTSDDRPHIFAGTEQAAMHRAIIAGNRPYMHTYNIPKSMVRPEIWADDLALLGTGWNQVHDLAPDGMPQLFEGVQVDPNDLKQGEVMQYRNHYEDEGNISHIFHKGDVHSKGIMYRGVKATEAPVDGLVTKEEPPPHAL